MDETGKIIVKNESGNEIECDVLFTFDSEDTKKSYIVYTDNEYDELGNIKIYANTYDSENDNRDLGPIETEEEWATIEQIFASINNKSEGGNNE